MKSVINFFYVKFFTLLGKFPFWCSLWHMTFNMFIYVEGRPRSVDPDTGRLERDDITSFRTWRCCFRDLITNTKHQFLLKHSESYRQRQEEIYRKLEARFDEYAAQKRAERQAATRELFNSEQHSNEEVDSMLKRMGFVADGDN